MAFLAINGRGLPAAKSGLATSGQFTPRSISGLALWLDGSDANSLYTTDAGAVTAVSSPTEISGCVGWWDSADLSSMRQNSDGTGTVAAGDPVGWWLDKSATGATVTGSGSARPTLSATGFNSRQALVFNGSSTNLSNAAYTATNSLSGMTRIAVCANTTNTTGALSRVFSGGSDFFMQMNGNARLYVSSAANFLGVSLSSNSNIAPAGLYADVFSNSAISFYSSGAGLAGTVTGTIPATTGGGTPAIHIGSNVGANLFWNGPIAEYIIFNRALTRAELASVESYLAAKWGISGVHVPATAASDPVGYWGDKSGNARHATQSVSASRPVVGTLNSRKALVFDGTNDNLFVEDYSVENSLSGLTRFIVFDSDSSAGMIFATTSASTKTANAGGATWWQRFGANWYGYIADGVRYHGGTTDESPHIATNFFDGTLAASFGTGLQNYIDGALLPVVGSLGTLGATTGASGAKLSIGSNLGINNFVNGKILELLSYTRALSSTERLRVNRYLAAKWNITLAPQVSNADAQDWINRVYANGGTVSSATASAVNTFCDAIDAAGIRDRFYRMGIFAGSNLNAALVPLYRGPSLGGTQYGGTTDTNVGPFVSGDYVETGATGGLVGNGTSKYLNTGFPTNTLADGNRHLAAYAATWPNAAYNAMLGSESTAGISNQFTLGHSSLADRNTFGCFSNTSRIQSSVISGGAFWIGINDAAGSGKLYRNGSQDGSAVLSASTPTASNVFVFAINRASSSSATDFFNGRLSGYSIGLSMTAPQAAAFYTAMQAFQTALGRNV